MFSNLTHSKCSSQHMSHSGSKGYKARLLRQRSGPHEKKYLNWLKSLASVAKIYWYVSVRVCINADKGGCHPNTFVLNGTKTILFFFFSEKHMLEFDVSSKLKRLGCVYCVTPSLLLPMLRKHSRWGDPLLGNTVKGTRFGSEVSMPWSHACLSQNTTSWPWVCFDTQRPVVQDKIKKLFIQKITLIIYLHEMS